MQNFPINALPLSIQQAVLDVRSVVKAPGTIAVSSALSAISLACQGLADVRRPNGQETPIGLYLLTIADSGERKTSCDKCFTRGIRQFEDAQAQIAEEKIKEFEFQTLIWKTQQKALLKEIAVSALADQGNDDLKIKLRTLMDQQPSAPDIPKLIYKDVTPPALAENLQRWNTGGIFSNEAGTLFDSPTFSNLGMYNTLWDGGEVTVDRKNAPPIKVNNARFTISLMVQSATLKKFLTGRGALARGNGALARYLVAAPFTNQGCRQEQVQPPVRTDALDAFNQRIIDLLQDGIGSDGKPVAKRILELSPDAHEAYIEFINQIELRLNIFEGYYRDVRDAASKIGDNMCRLAALFHCFEKKEGLIERQTIMAATQIATWYLEEFKRLFGDQPMALQEHQDAFQLETWLHNYERSTSFNNIKKLNCDNSVLTAFGPKLVLKQHYLS